MAENTAISWCDHTWSPVWGCTEVSKAETGGGGCDNCYARTLAHRFGYGWNGEPMREFGEHHWNEPMRWDRRAAAAGLSARVFPSMCDPFDKNWPAGIRERFFRLIHNTPHLTWLLLTKRIGVAHQMIGKTLIEIAQAEGGETTALLPTWPWPNVWLGATVVNQDEYDRDIGKLLRTPARVRFLSIEPMLGPIDLTNIRVGGGHGHHELDPIITGNPLKRANVDAPCVHWVIAGGESGPHARAAHPDWFRALRDQCATAGVPFHLKQNGEWLHEDEGGDLLYRDRMAVHAWPRGGNSIHVRKKAAGRLLDGVEHNGMPR